MPKKVSEIQKKELIDSFINGKTVEELSKEYNFTKLTIARNLKKGLGDEDYKKLLEKNNKKKENSFDLNYKSRSLQDSVASNISDQNHFKDESFMEIVPLNYEIVDSSQKDLASIPLADISFPKIVYMIVNKNIELEPKLLKEYPDWQFLPQEDLNRKTIEIFFDINIAKRLCNKERKVIKVPNTEVFRIAKPILISRGISRIISGDTLIAI